MKVFKLFLNVWENFLKIEPNVPSNNPVNLFRKQCEFDIYALINISVLNI